MLELALSLRAMAAFGGSNPYAAYAMALDFDDADYWEGGILYDPLSSMPGYSYTRTGTQGAANAAGDTVTFFAPNAPAITDAGYHGYGAVTNQLIQSQDLANAAWGNSATVGTMTRTAAAGTAPDGTTTATRIELTGASAAGYNFISQRMVGTPVSGNVTGSIWMRSRTGASFTVGLGVAWNSRSLQSCTVTPTWQRFTLVRDYATPGDVPGQQIEIGYFGSIGLSTDTAFDIDVWQGQAVDGNFPDGGPIIATAGATASVGASALALTVANGTYDATYTFDNDTTQNNAALVIADGTLNLPTDFSPNRKIVKLLTLVGP